MNDSGVDRSVRYLAQSKMREKALRDWLQRFIDWLPPVAFEHDCVIHDSWAGRDYGSLSTSWLAEARHLCEVVDEAPHDNQIIVLQAALAECYRLTGADPDGNEDWRLAPNAVAEVRRLREQADEIEIAFHTALGLLSEILNLDLGMRVKELLASKNLKG